MSLNIIRIDKIQQFARKLQKARKRIVLVGGCFDVLHTGHITFLQNAKLQGDSVVVLLEHDETIKKQKGQARPIHTQQERAFMLSALRPVDHIILLPADPANSLYDQVILALKPAIIATTAGDPNKKHKIRQAKMSRAKVVEVADYIENQSTSKLLTLLGTKAPL